jgi:hypothetical protein
MEIIFVAFNKPDPAPKTATAQAIEHQHRQQEVHSKTTLAIHISSRLNLIEITNQVEFIP